TRTLKAAVEVFTGEEVEIKARAVEIVLAVGEKPEVAVAALTDEIIEENTGVPADATTPTSVAENDTLVSKVKSFTVEEISDEPSQTILPVTNEILTEELKVTAANALRNDSSEFNEVTTVKVIRRIVKVSRRIVVENGQEKDVIEEVEEYVEDGDNPVSVVISAEVRENGFEKGIHGKAEESAANTNFAVTESVIKSNPLSIVNQVTPVIEATKSPIDPSTVATEYVVVEKTHASEITELVQNLSSNGIEIVANLDSNPQPKHRGFFGSFFRRPTAVTNTVTENEIRDIQAEESSNITNNRKEMVVAEISPIDVTKEFATEAIVQESKSVEVNEQVWDINADSKNAKRRSILSTIFGSSKSTESLENLEKAKAVSKSGLDETFEILDSAVSDDIHLVSVYFFVVEWDIHSQNLVFSRLILNGSFFQR
ncbi:hypothetical protein HK100_006159, partial [Physocladia obscura]